MPFPQNPPAVHTSKDSASKATVKQESHGENSHNIIVGDNSSVTIQPQSQFAVYAGRLTSKIPFDPSELVKSPRMLLNSTLELGNVHINGLSFLGGQRVLTVDGKPLVTIGVDPQGMWISATVVDAEGKFIVRVIENEFQASNERAFNPKMPDKHSLVVRDENGMQVLTLQYPDPFTIHLTGRFLMQDGRALIIDDERGIVHPNGGGISGINFNGNGMGVQIEIGLHGFRFGPMPPPVPNL